MNSTTLISAHSLITGDILPLALCCAEHKNIFSYCDTGEHSLLLSQTAGSVIAVSPDMVNLALAELKYVAVQHLPKEGRETLFGLNPFGRRVFLYHRIRTLLSSSARQFWDAHESWIRQGILRQGELDSQTQTTRTAFSRVFGQKFRHHLITNPSIESQLLLQNSRRWRWIVWYWSRALRKYGFTPQQLLQNLKQVLSTTRISEEPWLKQFFLPFSAAFSPLFVQLNALKESRIELIHGTVLEYLSKGEADFFDGFNLGCSLEPLSAAQIADIFDVIYRVGRNGARVIFWTHSKQISIDGKRFKKIDIAAKPEVFYNRIGVFSLDKTANQSPRK